MNRAPPLLFLCLLLVAGSSAWVVPHRRSSPSPARVLALAPRGLLHSSPSLLTRAAEEDDSSSSSSEDDRRAAYVAGKGLEGSGPLVVVNKFLPAGFRYAIYGLFGIVGGAGVAIATSQGKMDDAVLNGGGLVVALGLAALDISSQNSQIEVTKAVMKNENLASGMWKEEETEGTAAGGAAKGGGGDSNSADSDAEPKRIQTAADLFGDATDDGA